MGVSIFQSDKEIQKTLPESEQLDQRWTRHISKLKHNLTLDDDRSEQISIQMIMPPSKHTYCGICNCDYNNEGYLDHIGSDKHRNIIKLDKLYEGIDDLISEFNGKLILTNGQN